MLGGDLLSCSALLPPGVKGGTMVGTAGGKGLGLTLGHPGEV